MTKQFSVDRGKAFPLGTLRQGDWLNFALVLAPEVEEVTLCLFQPYANKLIEEIRLNPTIHRTGDVWHLAIQHAPQHVQYAYRIKGPEDPERALFFNSDQLILDPYAKAVRSHLVWGSRDGPYEGRGVCDVPVSFDWEGDKPLNLPLQDLVIYEMHIRGFTIDTSSKVKHPGSYLGVIEKIPYLKSLGVNAIEILPVFEFDECSYKKISPVNGEQLLNYWGYMSLNYFCPMIRFASRPGESRQPLRALKEFRLMVRELHRAGIEVILDVVYNHTGESSIGGSSISFRGLAPRSYYMLNGEHQFLNYSGCGNTFNANHPVSREFILESLRYWVTEMHVDGFRFDLASTLTRGRDGTPLGNPPLIEAISLDPVLAHTKLIAESWDAGGLYQVGSFPYTGRWSEWNGKYRDQVRRFIKGDKGFIGAFAGSLCGSEELYGYTGLSTASVNFIVAHDGFTLRDLVSYNSKHNQDNGEDNRDGTDDNASWNCGFEGATANRAVNALRRRQMRNLHLALMLSNGIPMILMGDEYGHTRGGNNNAWCHDSPLNWFLWDERKQDTAFLRYYKGLIHFRHQHEILRRGRFYNPEDITFHGTTPMQPDWSTSSQFLAFTLHDHQSQESLYAAFNAGHEKVSVSLPAPPLGFIWCKVADTAAVPPGDFITEQLVSKTPARTRYLAPPYSAILLKAIRS